MKYVKSINAVHDGSEIDRWMGYALGNTVNVVVRDTETGEEETKSLLGLLGEEVYGYGRAPWVTLVAVMDSRCLQLLDYIRVLPSSNNCWSADDALVHEVRGSLFRYYGLGACVCLCNYGENDEVKTLYEVLSEVFKSIGQPVLKAKCLLLYEAKSSICHWFELKHSPEADRFFMKMLML